MTTDPETARSPASPRELISDLARAQHAPTIVRPRRRPGKTTTIRLRAGRDYSPEPMRCPTCDAEPTSSISDDGAKATCVGGCGRQVDVQLRRPPNCQSVNMFRRHCSKLMGQLMREWNTEVLRPAAALVHPGADS